MKASFVTWQLRRLHAELDAIDQQRGDEPSVGATASSKAKGPRQTANDQAAHAALERMLRSLPKRLGFRDARAFLEAFSRAHKLRPATIPMRRRLSAEQVRELERRVLSHERASEIARAIGCAEQTVLNRASQLRRRLATAAEHDASGI